MYGVIDLICYRLSVKSKKNYGVTKWLAPKGLVGTTFQPTPSYNVSMIIFVIVLLPLLQIIIIDVYR